MAHSLACTQCDYDMCASCLMKKFPPPAGAVVSASVSTPAAAAGGAPPKSNRAKPVIKVGKDGRNWYEQKLYFFVLFSSLWIVYNQLFADQPPVFPIHRRFPTNVLQKRRQQNMKIGCFGDVYYNVSSSPAGEDKRLFELVMSDLSKLDAAKQVYGIFDFLPSC